MKTAIGVLGAIAIMGAGCAATDSGERGGELATEQSAIVGGVDSPASQDSVLFVSNHAEGTFCTASLIAPNLALTVRHCIAALSVEPAYCGPGQTGATFAPTDPPESIFLYSGVLGYTPAPAVKKIFVNEAYDNLCDTDMAVLLLEAPATGLPVLPIRIELPNFIGERFTDVGWGVDDTGNIPTYRQERKHMRVQYIGPKRVPDSTPTVPDYIGPAFFAAGEGPCFGDSGSPAISEFTGAVIGVTSGLNRPSYTGDDPMQYCYHDSSDYARTDREVKLLLKAFLASGYPPWIEFFPKPKY